MYSPLEIYLNRRKMLELKQEKKNQFTLKKIIRRITHYAQLPREI